MGRQIQIFMVNKDEFDFINKVIESGDYFIDDKGNKVTVDDIIKSPYHFWIVSARSRIIKRSIGYIDYDRIDGIQFIRSKLIEPQDQKINEAKESNLDLFEELKKAPFFKKGKFYPSHVDENKLAEFRNIKRVEPGRLWVQLKYYSSYDENARIICKEKWLEDKYNYYKRWIIKNYKISKDKMFYIGKETYTLNKEAGYKMMGGPIVEIEFD
jgi:hypothetical protein